MRCLVCEALGRLEPLAASNPAAFDAWIRIKDELGDVDVDAAAAINDLLEQLASDLSAERAAEPARAAFEALIRWDARTPSDFGPWGDYRDLLARVRDHSQRLVEFAVEDWPDDQHHLRAVELDARRQMWVDSQHLLIGELRRIRAVELGLEPGP